ncbi:MAG: flagellar hook-associated protein FlgK [Rhizobiales bacterium]|nr:flagellar hook-associated protein FlgK [Hyphomicrobiales bacterium]
MSLALALNAARSSLLTTAKQLAVSSRNIAGADDATYTRKSTAPVTNADGSVYASAVTRATNSALLNRLSVVTSGVQSQQAILDGLTRLQETIGDTTDTTSPAAQLGALTSALQALANAPSNTSLAQAVVTAAQGLAGSLNSATATVTSVRSQADADIATSVSKVNDLLSQFQQLNTQIMRGTSMGEDVTDAMDDRDAVITQLSEQMGITVVYRDNNDIALYTDSGVTLFDKSARSVTFQASQTLTPGTTGNAVYVDGVPVTGANAAMPLQSGKLVGLTQLRDTIAPTYQAQLDEMARGLVEAFAETDQSGGGGAALAGLFTWSGGPAVPASGTAVAGIAGSLTVNAAVDPSKGGSTALIRDGGINGAAYQYNATGAVGYSTHLQDLVDGMSASRAFDSSAAIGTATSLSAFATASVSWLSAARSTASTAVDYQNTLLSRASEALSNATGVNMDDEYALQLQLEQSYQASSKLVGIVTQMYDALLQAVG